MAKTMELKVRGMHCKSCETLVADALGELGAENIRVSHKEGFVTLSYDEKKLKKEKIMEAIEKEGYEVVE